MENISLDAARFHDEGEARKHLEGIRWPNGPICPHCENMERISKLNGKSQRAGLYFCGKCREQFTVTVGTVFERSKIPLHKWVLATHLICSSKKGMSSHQLHRMLNVTYKTAWFMSHRIRAAMTDAPDAELLDGTLEADETYVGGKPRFGGPKGVKRVGVPKRNRNGRPSTKLSNKTPVVALVQRDGNVRTQVVASVSAKNLKQVIRDNAAPSARIMTDQFISYQGIGKEFEGGHHTVNHSKREYARGDVHINSAESFFALLKRGIYGAFHHVSRVHLHRYTAEFAFRWNHRKDDDSDRAKAALGGIGGKRLLYRDPNWSVA